MTETNNKPMSFEGGSDSDTETLYEKIGIIKGTMIGVLDNIAAINKTTNEIKIKLTLLEEKIENLATKIESDKLLSVTQVLETKKQENKDKITEVTIKKTEKEEDFRLHRAECPAFQSNKIIKWLISLPVISTAITLVFYYLKK